MKEINTKDTVRQITDVERALTMYKETVSPSRATLINLLNQIPEKENYRKDGRAIRSPYIWLAITQVVTVFAILFALLPSITEMYNQSIDPFYSIDMQVQSFETQVNNEDAAQIVIDYNNNNL